MRVYHRAVQRHSGGSWAALAPDSAPTAVVKTTDGTTVQTLTSAYDAVAGRYYIATTDALYTASTLHVVTWTVTIGGTAYTTNGWFQSAEVSGGAAPGAPGIGTPTYTDTTATFPHTAPSDADYDHTVIYLVPALVGDVVTATGSGATIDAAGLEPGTLYYPVAIAYNAGGVASVVGADSVQSFATLPSAGAFAGPVGIITDMAVTLRCYVNEEALPIFEDRFDPTTQPMEDGQASDWRFYPRTRGRTHRVRIECAEPVPFIKVRSLGLLLATRQREVGGVRGDLGT